MPVTIAITDFHWLREVDSNYRPLGYEPNELPTAPPRDVLTKLIIQLIYVFCQYILKNISYISCLSNILYEIFKELFQIFH